MPACDLADHPADLRAVERRERNDAMVRAHGPGRAELRPRRRHDEQRRLGAALCQRPQEIERGRVGPVQVLEDHHGRLRTRSREIPRHHRGELPSPQFLRRRISSNAPRATECRPAARSGARIHPGRGQPDVKCSRGRRDAPRRSCRRRQNAVSPIRRAGAGACSAGAARRPIRPRCAASPRVLREIPRRGATCRCRARRRSERTDPRLRVRATSGVSAGQARPRGRPTASAREPRPAGRRRSPARRDRAQPAPSRP